jgi:enterochelin esterase-like enzyme
MTLREYSSKSVSLLLICAAFACSETKNDAGDAAASDAGMEPSSGGTGGMVSAGGAGAGGTAGNAALGGTASGGEGGVAGMGGMPDLDAGNDDSDASPIFTDPGSAGDGNFVLDPGHAADVANTFQGAPLGQLIGFQMLSSESTIYPGIRGPYTRNVWAYVPQQYVAGTPAPVIVVQDGGFAVWLGNDAPHTRDPNATNLPGTANLPMILDNLIGAGELPTIVAIFVDNGGGDAEGSERGLEYDTVSGKYAEFVETEVFPRVESEVQTQLDIALAITDDPRGRATLGGSSGGAAAFSMAWWHPDLFTRVISYSGTFVRQASPEDPMFPHGCWSYHDFDPFDPALPNGLIMQEATAKPLRVWLEVAQNDSGAGSGPNSYRDFKLANERMAASLAAQGYHYHYDYAEGAGHFDGTVIAETLPNALRWSWRGYPLD